MLRFATLVATCAALVLATGAAAKETTVWVSKPAAAPREQVPWVLTVHVLRNGRPYAKQGYRPTLYLVGKSRLTVDVFRGVPAGAGTFRVAVVFPRPGTWRYVIPDPLNGEWWFVSPHVAV